MRRPAHHPAGLAVNGPPLLLPGFPSVAQPVMSLNSEMPKRVVPIIGGLRWEPNSPDESFGVDDGFAALVLRPHPDDPDASSVVIRLERCRSRNIWSAQRRGTTPTPALRRRPVPAGRRHHRRCSLLVQHAVADPHIRRRDQFGSPRAVHRTGRRQSAKWTAHHGHRITGQDRQAIAGRGSRRGRHRESLELPGADLSSEDLTMPVVPQGADKFTCTCCFLLQHRSRLASRPGTPCS